MAASPTTTVLKTVLFFVITFVVYSFAGYWFERIVAKKDKCRQINDTNTETSKWCLPALPIYGCGAALLAIVAIIVNYYFLKSMSAATVFLVKVLVAAIAMPVFECLAGQLSLRVNQCQTWTYDDEHDSGPVLCGGYVSLKSAATWTLMAALYFLFDPVQLAFAVVAGGTSSRPSK